MSSSNPWIEADNDAALRVVGSQLQASLPRHRSDRSNGGERQPILNATLTASQACELVRQLMTLIKSEPTAAEKSMREWESA